MEEIEVRDTDIVVSVFIIFIGILESEVNFFIFYIVVFCLKRFSFNFYLFVYGFLVFLFLVIFFFSKYNYIFDLYVYCIF